MHAQVGNNQYCCTTVTWLVLKYLLFRYNYVHSLL